MDKKITFVQTLVANSFFKNEFVMKIIKRYFFVLQCSMMALGLFLPSLLVAQDARFTLVIDAGHGGHDPGAMGSISREKQINLAVALDLGELVEENFKDVKVVYTRKTDKYLTLQERADVVNNNHADLFICIHTNASSSPSAYGAETFTLGLAKSKANLDVAMRENSVILLEEDYRTKYKGFDPASIDSYIMFEFMQDKYIDRSVELASTIQKQFVNYCSRSDRGVRQAGFWVLHRSACPSVLVELGFISNRAEERYLNSESGQKEMATAIYKSFINYKRDHDRKSGRQTVYNNRNSRSDKADDSIKSEAVQSAYISVPTAELPETPEVVSNARKASRTPVFKLQLFASKVKIKSTSAHFKGIRHTDFYYEGGFYKYTVGEETDFDKIEKIRKNLHPKFPDAFVIAFIGDNKVSVKEAQNSIK